MMDVPPRLRGSLKQEPVTRPEDIRFAPNTHIDSPSRPAYRLLATRIKQSQASVIQDDERSQFQEILGTHAQYKSMRAHHQLTVLITLAEPQGFTRVNDVQERIKVGSSSSSSRRRRAASSAQLGEAASKASTSVQQSPDASWCKLQQSLARRAPAGSACVVVCISRPAASSGGSASCCAACGSIGPRTPDRRRQF